MTSIIVPPLEEPKGEVCSIHNTMEVEKPRMAMVLILLEEGIEPCLLVIPICICSIKVLRICTEVHGERDRLV